MCLNSEMNTFGENPLFLFVDDLADGSPNFAAEGKIVEIFDTGCDARTPGGAFEVAKKPDVTIERKGSTQSNIPNVRKPFSLSLRQDKILAKKNTSFNGQEEARGNIAGALKSPKQRKPTTWNSPKDKVPTKTGLNTSLGNPSDGKAILEKEKAKPKLNRTWLSAKYGESNRKVDLKLISSSIPKRYKGHEDGSKNSSTIERRAKTNPRTNSQTKTSRATSEATLNHGVKEFINRAVDKDSLSNCSRQLEMAKTCRAPSVSKTGYASRLPRSAGAAKILSKNKPTLSGIGKETAIKVESKTGVRKMSGGTDHELQDKRLLRIKTPKETEATALKGSLETTPKLVPQKKPEDNVRTKLTTKNNDLDKLVATFPTRSASKMPLPRNLCRDLSIVQKNVRSIVNVDEVIKAASVSDGKESRSKETPSSKIDYPNLEKAPVRPSVKSHNLTSREPDAKNEINSFQTKLPKPRTPSIVPKLMSEFRRQYEKQNEILRPSVPPIVKTEKLGTESNSKPPSSSGTLKEHLNDKLDKFFDRVEQVLTSKTHVLDGVSECTEVDHQGEQSKSKVDVASVLLSRFKAVDEKEEEIELRTIFEDASTTVIPRQTPKSSTNVFGRNKTAEPKLRRTPLSDSAESKVPRPAVTKGISKVETARNSSAKTWPKKQESSTFNRASKNSVKIEVKKEPRPSTPSTLKSVVHLPENTNLPETSIGVKEDEDEDAITIMNPANLCNVSLLATHYHKRRNLENAKVPQETVRRGKLETWIDGHEQAYLKGRAIGLKVANMARAAKQDLKLEFVRSGLENTSPLSLLDKSREIVDIGISVIEKVLAEKNRKIHSPSVRGDQAFDYHDFDKNSKWNGSRQWFT